jgi:hypothetical protein
MSEITRKFIRNFPAVQTCSALSGPGFVQGYRHIYRKIQVCTEKRLFAKKVNEKRIGY